MRKLALLGASALVLALGIASASAEPSGQSFLTRGSTQISTVNEGRAAAIGAPTGNALTLQSNHAGR